MKQRKKIKLGGLLLACLSINSVFSSNITNNFKTVNNRKLQHVENYVIFLNVQPLKKNILSKENSDLITQLNKMFHLKEVRSDLVRKHEEAFLAHPDAFNETVIRSASYMPFVVNEVKKRNMPGEIALLPFIESRYTPGVKSRVGAKGIWQFMPATGKQYGLDQTNLYDGRDDFYAATKAALDYLEFLYGLFGDWTLAIAAYNVGENRVQKAIEEAQRKGLEPVFANLRLPKETTNYVPKLLAVRNIIKNQKTFGVPFESFSNKPYFESIKINHPVSLQTIARLADVSLSKIQELNPSYKTSIYVPNQNRNILIPKSSYRHFFDNYHKVLQDENVQWYALKLKKRHSLSELSDILNIPVSELRNYNNIYSESVEAGKTIFVKIDHEKNLFNLQSANFSITSLSDFEIPETFSRPRIIKVAHKRNFKIKSGRFIKISNKKNKISQNKKTSINKIYKNKQKNKLKKK